MPPDPPNDSRFYGARLPCLLTHKATAMLISREHPLLVRLSHSVFLMLCSLHLETGTACKCAWTLRATSMPRKTRKNWQTSAITFANSWSTPSSKVNREELIVRSSDQYQISPAASPVILHHKVWRTWLFIAYSNERWWYYQFSLHYLHIFSLEGWENVCVELGSERVKQYNCKCLLKACASRV